MKDWDLWLVIALYSIALVWFGGWIEYKIVNVQLPGIVDKAWTEGCKRCGQIEKEACVRDNTLFGVPEHPQPISHENDNRRNP